MVQALVALPEVIVDACDIDGATPLMFAAEKGQKILCIFSHFVLLLILSLFIAT